MRNNFTSARVLYLIGVIVLFFFSSLLKAQIDNSLTDHVPLEYIKYIESYQIDGPEAVITDASGYDNFNLGVAFA